MTTGAISLDAVSKGYRHYRRPMDRVRELLSRTPRHAVHWALEDISLTVSPGETVGLLGENGSGKSSLLKLIAGTTKPTRGRLTVDGQVAALLELGAGFHPEESGRENVLMMAALAGIPAHEMAQHYASVADFCELPEDVLERPVKTYSSGMFMRLGFATATAVDPDILIVDEALSVGDIHFQKKSLDRILQFRDDGKTVLFCSHNLYQIRSLCSRAVWLHQGRIRAVGDTEEVVTAYESFEREKEGLNRSAEALTPHFKRTSSSFAPVRITDVRIGPTDGRYSENLETHSDVSIFVELDSSSIDAACHVGVAIVRNDRENVFGTSTHFTHASPVSQGQGKHRVALRFPSFPLLSGDYLVSVYALDDSGLQVIDQAELICPFTVFNGGRTFGMVDMPCEWQVSEIRP